jgi:protein-tyrosine-phosphatase/8-oxo-dGTP pyrophosphatase MutT (NUDIX family)
MAQAVLDHHLRQAGLGGQVEVTSSGVSDEEHGHGIDRRAAKALRRRGYGLPQPHSAHRITDRELSQANLIFAMTYAHYQALRRRGAPAHVVRMYGAFDPAMMGQAPSAKMDIDDPWYGGEADFEAALDQIEAATPRVVRRIQAMVDRGGRVDLSEGWHECRRCGSHHWGVFGGAGLLAHRGGEVLLQLRGGGTHHPDTWGIPGGARHQGESALACALREAGEEMDLDTHALKPDWWRIVDHGGWTYTTVAAGAGREAGAQPRNWEATEARWVALDQVGDMDLHPGLGQAWAEMRPLIGARLTLVVDVANVMGTTPDGWWKDRAGAAARLLDRLSHLASTGLAQALLEPGLVADVAGWYPRIVAVVEGQARVVDAVPRVEVVAAPAVGDDQIVAVAQEAVDQLDHGASRVVVATADKALQARLRAVGAGLLAPGALLKAL